MKLDLSQSIEAALADVETRVRIGAIRAASTMPPDYVKALLTERYEKLKESLPTEEALSIARALAYAGADASGITARLLGAKPDAVGKALEGGADEWLAFVRKQTKEAGLKGPYGLLGPMAAWKARKIIDAGNQPAADLAAIGLSKLDLWKHAAAGFKPAKDYAAILDGAFENIETQLRGGKTNAAINELIQILVMSPDPVFRFVARNTLPAFGIGAAGQLLEVVSGDSGLEPDNDVYDSLEKEMRSGERIKVSRPILAAYFASEALELFNDRETAAAVAAAAITWPGDIRLRAERIAARMSADIALPPLVWRAANHPSAARRAAATGLLSGILAKRDDLGIRHHHIDLREYDASHFQWLKSLQVPAQKQRPWMADPLASISIIGASIEATKDIAGSLNLSYATPPAGLGAIAYEGFVKRVKSLKGKSPTAGAPEPEAGDDPETEAAPAAIVRRYPDTEFPAVCRQGKTETLKVWIVAEQQQRQDPALDIPFEKGVTETQIQVFIRAPGFDADSDHQTIRIARQGPSSVAEFPLTPRDPGAQAIDVKFYHGAALLGQSRVITTISRTERRGKAERQLIDHLEGDALAVEQAAATVLYVKTLDDGHLNWRLFKPDGAIIDLGVSPQKIPQALIDQHSATQSAIIKDLLKNDMKDGEIETVLNRLSAEGYSLYKQIAPASLKPHLAELHDGDFLIIDSDADWVAWELLAETPKADLWGERFVLVRAPVLTKVSNAYVAKPGTLSEGLKDIALIIGDGIQYPKRLASRIFDRKSKLVVRPEMIKKDLGDIKNYVKGRDVVHFNCHGRSIPSYHLSYKEGPLGQLIPAMAHNLNLKWGAVVFANACSSGATDMLLAEFQSFGREFYYAGARPFIGTLGPVPEEQAVDFSRIFYKFFATEGFPAGQAMRMAREEAATKFKRPVWLFYCLYGSPQINRTW